MHRVSSTWEHAAEIAWEDFYRAVEGRALRPLFVDATPHLPAVGEPPPVAIDLGCGDGTETLELLRRGWQVFAVDGSPDGIARIEQSAPPAHRERLTTQVARFADADLPPADLVYAGLSLPFCEPRDFGAVWDAVTSALRPNGLFVGHLFGPNDTWADTPDMTFRTREEVEAMLADFYVLQLREEDADGQAVGGAKHWHVFHVIARKRA